MKNLQDLGWSIGIRFDPLIWNNQKDKYKDFFSCVFDFLNIKKFILLPWVHSECHQTI